MQQNEPLGRDKVWCEACEKVLCIRSFKAHVSTEGHRIAENTARALGALESILKVPTLENIREMVQLRRKQLENPSSETIDTANAWHLSCAASDDDGPQFVWSEDSQTYWLSFQIEENCPDITIQGTLQEFTLLWTVAHVEGHLIVNLNVDVKHSPVWDCSGTISTIVKQENGETVFGNGAKYP